MNPHLLSTLEKLKIGDIKSSMDQIRSLYGEIALIKQEIETLFTELDSKVSLVSRKLDGPSTVSKLGTGIIASITNNGTVLNGTGTLFSKEVAIGNQIKIGSETVTVTGLDSLSPDIKMTVTPALVGSYTNQIFAIIKTATKELLKGEFDFGELNGDAFNGVIRQGSSLETYGRMTQPADVVNVSFVQKQTTPIMVRAQNAIQRDGDNISGPLDSRYIYTFDNTNFNFGPNVELTYEGVTSSPTNLVTRADLTAIHNSKGFIYLKIIGTAFNLAQIPASGDEVNFFATYFDLVGNSFKCKVPCIGFVNATLACKGNSDQRHSELYVDFAITINGVRKAEAVTAEVGSSAYTSIFVQGYNGSVSLMHQFAVGDTVEVPLSVSSATGFQQQPQLSFGMMVFG
jgi:hypothetical protein